MTQKVELGVTIFKMEMEKARRRQEATQLAGRDQDYKPIFKSSVSPISDTPSKEAGRADEIAAKKVGLGKDTLRKGNFRCCRKKQGSIRCMVRYCTR